MMVKAGFSNPDLRPEVPKMGLTNVQVTQMDSSELLWSEL